jgi:hypothetical protein
VTAQLDLPVAGPVSPLLSRPGLKVPTYTSIPDYDDTLGDEAGGFAADIGMPPDPQEQLILDIVFARAPAEMRNRPGGKPSAAYETGVVVSRQNLKTASFEMVALTWLYLFNEPLVVWSAHEYVTSQEAQFHMEGLILNSDLLRPKTARIVHANGSECIETVWGSRMIFKTRTKTGGRGLSANKVVLDEAFALKSGHMGALLPTMSAKPDPQVLYGSSACLEDSEILAELVGRGRPGDERDWESGRPLHQMVSGPLATAFLEWCSPPPSVVCAEKDKCAHEKPKFDLRGNQVGGSPGCGCDNPVMWEKANPSVGIERPDGGMLTLDYIRAERKSLPIDQFPRERMGWHDRVDGARSPLPPIDWAACADKRSTPRLGSPLALAFAVAPDGSSASVGLGGWRADGLPHGELIEHLPGTGWLMEFLLGVWERQNPCCLVMDPMGPSGAFEKILRQERGPDGAKTCFVTVPKDKPGPPKLMPGQRLLMVTSSREVAQGAGMLANRVIEGTFRHPDQKPLNDAARDVRKRPVAQAWAFDSPDGKDIGPIQAVMLAQLGLATFGAKTPLTPFVVT